MEPVVIATADVPNKNGHLYSRSVLEQAIKKCDGVCYGQLGMPVGSSLYSSLEDVSHVVENLRFDDSNRLIGTIRPLRTPKGEILRALLDEKVNMDFRLAGIGDASSSFDGVVKITNFEICSINAVNDGA